MPQALGTQAGGQTAPNFPEYFCGAFGFFDTFTRLDWIDKSRTT